jgi:hypothetical protein
MELHISNGSKFMFIKWKKKKQSKKKNAMNVKVGFKSGFGQKATHFCFIIH